MRCTCSISFAFSCCLVSAAVAAQEEAKDSGPDDADRAGALAADEVAAQLRSLRMFVGGESAGPGGQPDLGGMTSLLMTNDALQQELGLTERQAERLKEITTEARRRQGELFRRMKETGGEFRTDQAPGEITEIPQAKEGFDPGAMREELFAIGRESDGTIGQVLTPKQRRRLYQIALRIEGATALARPDVAVAVGLAQPQREAISAIANQLKTTQQDSIISQMERASPPAREPGATAPGGVKAIRDAGEEQDRLHKAAERRIASMLNASQKKAFNRLLGPDFDLTLLIRPPVETSTDADTREKDPAPIPKQNPKARKSADPE